MRTFLPFLIFLSLWLVPAIAQERRSIYDRLIYPPEILTKLAQTTAALNRQLLAIPVKKTFSTLQGYGRPFQILNASFPLDSLKKDLKKGLSYPALSQKYPEIEWEQDSLLIYRFERINWPGKPEQVFAVAPFNLGTPGISESWLEPETVGAGFVFDT